MHLVTPFRLLAILCVPISFLCQQYVTTLALVVIYFAMSVPFAHKSRLGSWFHHVICEDCCFQLPNVVVLNIVWILNLFVAHFHSFKTQRVSFTRRRIVRCRMNRSLHLVSNIGMRL